MQIFVGKKMITPPMRIMVCVIVCLFVSQNAQFYWNITFLSHWMQCLTRTKNCPRWKIEVPPTAFWIMTLAACMAPHPVWVNFTGIFFKLEALGLLKANNIEFWVRFANAIIGKTFRPTRVFVFSDVCTEAEKLTTRNLDTRSTEKLQPWKNHTN